MKKSEIIKIMLIDYVSREMENHYSQYQSHFIRAQEPQEMTVPEALGEDIFNQAVIDLDEALAFKEGFADIFDISDFNEKDIAFYLLDLPNEVSEEAKDLIMHEDNLFSNKAYDLMLKYDQNQSED